MGGMISYILSDYNTTIRARQAEQDEGSRGIKSIVI